MSGRIPHRDRSAEDGSAVVEMAVLGTLVFTLLIQLIVAFGAVQQAMLAAASAARDAGRAVSLAVDDADASARAGLALRIAARNHGLDARALHVDVHGLVVRDGVVTITVATDVPLIHLPALGAVWKGLALPVSARATVRIDRFRSFDRAS